MTKNWDILQFNQFHRAETMKEPVEKKYNSPLHPDFHDTNLEK